MKYITPSSFPFEPRTSRILSEADIPFTSTHTQSKPIQYQTLLLPFLLFILNYLFTNLSCAVIHITHTHKSVRVLIDD